MNEQDVFNENYKSDVLQFDDLRESEQMLLGTILWEPNLFQQIHVTLKPDNFRYDSHREIYSALLNMFENHTEIELHALYGLLENRGKLELVGGSSYLTYLTSLVIHSKVLKDSEEMEIIITWLRNRDEESNDN